MSRRQLNDAERALWSRFAHSVTPLRPSPKSAKPATTLPVKPSKLGETVPPARPRASARDGMLRSAAKSPPLAPLGRRFKQQVSRGRAPIDARIDLHGLTQTQAHAALLRFLRGAQADGARIALIVTGKGSVARDAETGRGVLRRHVPLWLALPEFRQFIVGFEDAHVGHGGEGALYVRLRRER